MLGVSGTATVTEKADFVSFTNRFHADFAHLFNNG
jgi:hypothetical protein